MKIAILTSGIMPVPAVQGGAVENLIDYYLEYNDRCKKHDITVYSISAKDIKKHPALKSKVNHYRFIEKDGIIAKIKKAIYLQKTKGLSHYYHHSVEFFLEQTLRHIRKNNYDWIVIENRPGYVLKLKDTTTAQLAIHQGNDYLNNQTPNCREIYDAASCVINISEFITQRVLTINPDDRKCRTVFNGIDTALFYRAVSMSRDQIGLRQADFVVVFSGRLTKDKGVLQLIQAIKSIQNIPELKLLIIGGSSYGKDNQPTPFIEQLIKESEPIKDKIVFTGYISYDQVPSYLKAADVAVIPSMWEEPFGLTVVEAMAAGLPLITTNSGGIPEICEGVAMIVDRDDIVNNLAAAILDLYEHPEKRAAMSKASLHRSKLFDKETYARNFFEALESFKSQKGNE